MRDSEGFNLKITDRKRRAGPKAFPSVDLLELRNFLSGSFIHKDRHLVSGQKSGYTADMVTVSVGEKNRIDFCALQLSFLKPPFQTPRTKAQVD